MTTKTRKILVTGGTGLVGTALAQYVQDNHEADWVFVSSSDADLLEWEQVRELFAFHQPTHVVHLAAMVGGLFHNMSANFNFLMSNLQMNLNLVRACDLYDVKKLVSCMSTCIFPDGISDVFTEDDVQRGPPHPSNFGYAYAKRMLDVMNRAHSESIDSVTGVSVPPRVVFTSIIPCNVYGPHDNFHLEQGHVIPALIHRAHLSKGCLKVAGSGKPLRQFIYSKDLAKLIVWAVDHYDSCEPIILSPEEEVSIESAARTIASEFGIDSIQFMGALSDGQHKKTASNAKLRALLPEFEFTPFEEGIKETVEWFKFMYPEVRK